MTDSGGEAGVSGERILAAFDRSGSPSPPLATEEVVAALDAPPDAVVRRLESLVEAGDLRSKVVGEDRRVWWVTRPVQTGHQDGTVPDGEYALELEFHSRELAGTVGQVAAADDGSALEVRIEGDVPLSDGRRIQYYSATGVSPKPFVEMLGGFDSVRDVRLLGISGDACRVEAEIGTESLSATFAAFGGRLKSGAYRDGVHHTVGEVPGDVDPDEVVAAVRSVYPEMEHHATRRIVTSRQFYRIADAELTDRQFTALRLAFYGGYFQQSRESTGEELAARLGITKQTFNAHLRKALQALFEELFREAETADADRSA